MINIIKNFLLILLLGIVVLLGYNQKKTQKVIEDSDFVLAATKKELHNKIDGLNSKENLQLQYEGIQLQDFNIVIDNKTEIPISHLVEARPIVVYRKPEFSCNDCFGDIVEELQANDFLRADGSIIMFTYEHWEDIEFIADTYSLQNSLLANTKEPNISIPIDSVNNNYLFVLMPDLTITHVYFPSIDNKIGIQEYVKGIRRFCHAH